MTPAEFEAALAALNWKKIDFCRAVDVDPSTVSRWMGSEELPKWVSTHLALLLDIRALHNRYLQPAKPSKPAA